GGEDQLHEPGAVTQVDEDESAVVAAAVHPARHPHAGVDPVGQHLAAPGVAIVVRPQSWEDLAHGDESVSTSVAESTSRSSPESMFLSFALPSPDRITAKRAPMRSACFICPLIARSARSR